MASTWVVPYSLNADYAFLVTDVAWDDHVRARQTASFGLPYNYSGQHYDLKPMPPRIAAIATRAAEHAGHPFNNCLSNRYEAGDNTMGFHQDSYTGLSPDSTIAIVSLGATRRLVFRSIDQAHRTELALEHASNHRRMSLVARNAVSSRGWGTVWAGPPGRQGG